jgi:hypothetical protein
VICHSADAMGNGAMESDAVRDSRARPDPMAELERLTITSTCRQAPDSRSTRGSAWRATVTIDGVTYEAKSRSSVVAALCRELVAAGVPDGPMTVTFDGVPGRMTIRSIHKFAGTALTEGDGPIRRVKWHPLFAFSPAVPAARDEAGMGSTVSPGSPRRNASLQRPQNYR